MKNLNPNEGVLMMVKKSFLSLAVLVYLFYAYAIATNNNTIGDILSPFIMLIITCYIFYGYVILQKIKKLKWFGLLLTLSVFIWFFCDFLWGVQTLVLHLDPENNFITLYGYSLTNLFLFFTIVFSGYQDLKRMNKIQALLDTLIVSLCMAVLLWLFVFEQKSEKVLVLLSDPISMSSLILDVIIYAWINVWAFSTRIIHPPFFHRLIVTGGLIFVITDFIYYYMYFYLDYEPNSWIDGAYVLAFSIIALSVTAKKRSKKYLVTENLQNVINLKMGFDILILLAPVFVFIFKRSQIQYFIILVVALLVYYVLINFSQKSMFQGKLLELEKKNVLELEKKVIERTDEIYKLLNTDFITGLYSRRYFEAKLTEIVLNIKMDEKISLLYIDQNKSKAIKYLYGKETAEILLKKVAEATEQVVIENNGTIAAYGDDVFVIMIKGTHADTEAEKIAEQIINRCNELFFVNNHAIRVTLNIGIACYPIDTPNENDLIKNADVAMMQARAKGFNQIQLYNENIGNLTYSRHRIELKLKKVVFDKEFQLYFQPQVLCKSGKLCGFESLIRWYEEGKGFISPLDFIPITEEIGLIVPLGYWIMENAARQYASWKEKTGESYRISVNVSSKQLVEVDFVIRLQDILTRYHMPANMFEIEITESQQIENSINILETLEEIKKLGVSIAIDDFGTGYSSLYYIKHIPTDRIKIAKELIDNIENDVYANSILQMVISIAKVKGIKVIAEGVETIEQLECLRELECDEIQGYYFAKPLPADEIERKWLVKNNE